MSRSARIIGSVSLSLIASGAQASAMPTATPITSPFELSRGSELSAAVKEIIAGNIDLISKVDKPAALDMEDGLRPVRTAASFAQFPNHFSQDKGGPFSNFSRGKTVKARKRVRALLEPMTISAIFEKFRPT